MLPLENLLRNEYFPVELPKCFSSEAVIKHIPKIKGWVCANSYKSSVPLKYSGFKSETARRKFAVPNFYHYFKAANYISDHSVEIFKITDATPHSLTAPRHGSPDPAYAYCKKSHAKRYTKAIVEKMYLDNSFMIKLDITAFFDSIYTHSLSWAIHSKKMAKRIRDKSLWGNELDMHIRSFNSDQTNGVLVGNALSRICSELILCKIDKAIDGRFENLQYARFVDDYYIFVKKEEEIQHVLSFIRQQLSEYELILNENKIVISKSPFLFDSPWMDELKMVLHSAPEPLINKSIALYTQYGDISILKYVLKAISLQNVDMDTWDRIESKIYNLWARFPSLTELILNLLLQRKDDIHRLKLKAVLYTNLEKCLTFNLQQELVWIVWSLKVFNINIKQEWVIKILESANDLSSIILLDCLHSGIISKTTSIEKAIKNKKQELELLDIDDKGSPGALMWTSNWLLAYECQLHGWLDSGSDKFEAVNNNCFFKELLKIGIDFYDATYSMTLNIAKYRKHSKHTDEIKKYLELVQKALTEYASEGLIEEIKQINQNLIDKVSDETY